MSYKSAITDAMTEMGRDPAVCFVGYGIRYGKAMGTLANVSESQLIEMPVAENLMVGFATGLALRGRKPVVFIERADFLLHALDATVNHLAKINLMSRGEFAPAVMLRVIIGNSTKPLFTGETHTQDFSDELRSMVGNCAESKHHRAWFDVKRFDPHEFIQNDITASIAEAHERMARGHSAAFFELKDQY